MSVMLHMITEKIFGVWSIGHQEIFDPWLWCNNWKSRRRNTWHFQMTYHGCKNRDNEARRCIIFVCPPTLQCSSSTDILRHLYEHRLIRCRCLFCPVLLRPFRDSLPAHPTGSAGTPATQHACSVPEWGSLLPVATAVTIQQWDIYICTLENLLLVFSKTGLSRWQCFVNCNNKLIVNSLIL